MNSSAPIRPEQRQRKSDRHNEPLDRGLRGRVVRWLDRGFGFIHCAEYSKDIFVHAKNVAGDGRINLLVDQEVTFDLVETEKGYSAINVQIVS